MKNYLSEMLYALTSAYSRKDYDNHQQGRPLETNIGKLFSLFAWGLDIVQENFELVKQWDDLEQAKGAVLDRYGANWGVQRFSENDALYRLAIRVKILSQLSGGDTDTVIRAAADLLGIAYTDIEFKDIFPAKISICVDRDLLSEERLGMLQPIAIAIKRILATGVGMELALNIVLPPTTLHIGGAPGAITCMGIPAAADTPAFSAPLHVGGAFGAGQSFSVPEDPSPPSATTILRTGGVCTIISNLSLSKGE